MTTAGARIAISQRANAADNDRSFKSWTCAEGLACQVLGDASRMGMCFIGNRQAKP